MCVLAAVLYVLNPGTVEVLFAGHRPPGLQIKQAAMASWEAAKKLTHFAVFASSIKAGCAAKNYCSLYLIELNGLSIMVHC